MLGLGILEIILCNPLYYIGRNRPQGGGDVFKVTQQAGRGAETRCPSPESKANLSSLMVIAGSICWIQQKATSAEAVGCMCAQQAVVCINLPKRNGKWKNSEHWEKKCQMNLPLNSLFCRETEVNIAHNTKLSDLTWKRQSFTSSEFYPCCYLRYFSLSLSF